MASWRNLSMDLTIGGLHSLPYFYSKNPFHMIIDRTLFCILMLRSPCLAEFGIWLVSKLSFLIETDNKWGGMRSS